MSKYTFTKIEDFDVLMKFWSASPDATIFTHPDVLPKLVDQVEWWMAYKGEDPVCLWPICKTGFRNGGYSRFAYYVGPMWSKDHKMLSAHRWLQSSGQVYSGFIDRFKVDRHPTEVSLAPTLTDVRHFLWTNSIPSELPEIQVIPRYTAILDLSDLKPQNILKCVSTNRNREILRIEKSEAFSITKKIETEQALKLYESFFAEKNITMHQKEMDKVIRLCELVESGYGRYTGYIDTTSGELVSIVILLYDRATANLVLNLTHQAYKSSGIGTATLFNAILTAKHLGLQSFDFNGVNHPQRAFYKHSFGAEPKLYFDLKLNWT
jgi:hypothetical protein